MGTNEKDMTAGSPGKLIITFAIPMMLGNIFQQFYTMADTMIVGQVVGVKALAAVGAGDWLVWLVLGIMTGITQGFSILVSQYYGAREKENLKCAVAKSYIMTACGWCIGMICAGIMVLINPEEVFDLEMLAMELITFFVFQAIAGIMIAIRIRFEGEKGRIVLPIAILIIFAICYTIRSFVKTNLGLKESILHMIGGIGDLEIAIALIVLSLLIWFASYKYSMSAMKKKEF